MRENIHAQPEIQDAEPVIQDPTSELRLGVVICECGDKIAGQLDTESLRRQVAALPGVVYAVREVYPCSKDGRARLRQAIADQKLDRVLIAGCTPRLIERLFRQVGQEAGLASRGGGLEVTDIREHCAYVHANDREAAAQKAVDLIEMGVARLAATRFAPNVHTGRVVKSAMVIGGGLSGLTVALALAEEGISVTLIEEASALGNARPGLAHEARETIPERIEAVSRQPRILTLLSARVTEVKGRPGDYEVRIAHDGQITTFAIGAIVIAEDARPKGLNGRRWYDRSRVVTQAEFESEHAAIAPSRNNLVLHDIVMILCAEEAGGGRCSRVCCLAGIRQAVRAKQLNPNANVTILFRDLYLGGGGDLHADELQRARELGVTFFRYQKDHPPTIGDKTVNIHDSLTGESVRVPFDRVVLSTPLEPPAYSDALAALLHVPQDDNGFLVEPPARLRPGRYADDGVYALDGAHQPVDEAEALFQAYVTSARVIRFLSQKEIRVEASAAVTDAALCTGCGNCVPVCPTAAIALVPRQHDGVLSLAEVEALRCTGCGNCVVACPARALTLPGWDDAAILAQISAALRVRGELSSTARVARRVVVLACEWSAYAAADMAGVRRLSYPTDVRIIRMPCSARFDPNHILWAFINGADGVFLGACLPGECHYGAGNLYAKERVEALKKQLAERGFDPRRLRLEFLPGDDGKKFAQVMTDFVEVLTGG
ncbi:MAG TPA: FAD-dependent oxidoreductase [Anaerolineales bacterium]|nr:FAD-dependent oxidoreductase [Anaerolineales bacterium]